jgi:hypothetical protein
MDIKYQMCPLEKIPELNPNQVCPPQVVIKKVKTLKAKVNIIALHTFGIHCLISCFISK